MPRYSPGALALMGHGVTGDQIAKALNASPSSVARWLRGDYPAPEAMYVAIAALGDQDLARHVRELVDEGRARSTRRTRRPRWKGHGATLERGVAS